MKGLFGFLSGILGKVSKSNDEVVTNSMIIESKVKYLREKHNKHFVRRLV